VNSAKFSKKSIVSTVKICKHCTTNYFGFWGTSSMDPLGNFRPQIHCAIAVYVPRENSWICRALVIKGVTILVDIKLPLQNNNELIYQTLHYCFNSRQISHDTPHNFDVPRRIATLEL